MKIAHNGIILEVTEQETINDILTICFGSFVKEAEKPHVEKRKKRKHFPLGIRPWTREDKENFEKKYRILAANNNTPGEIIKVLSREFNRTSNAISNYIYKAKLNRNNYEQPMDSSGRQSIFS